MIALAVALLALVVSVWGLLDARRACLRAEASLRRTLASEARAGLGAMAHLALDGDDE